jgi:4-alpha-glucanotransferase
VLEELARHFFDSPRGARWQAFQQFATPEVENYARFRATCEQMQKPWQQWPERMRQGILWPSDFSKRIYQWHLYTQWLAQQQIKGLLDDGRRRHVQMYLDLPLGVHPASYDTLCHQDVFALNAQVGSPPDPTFQQGQDWAFAPLHPQRLRESGYRYLRDYLGFQMRHTGMLRIDHVMGLHRLYWIPAGHEPSEGAYVTYNPDELYAIFCLESHRHKTVLVGEDLGTVPPEVPKRMARHGFSRMYVVQYSLHPKRSRALSSPPANCVASLNTHDMPSFAAFCQSLDIMDRAALGLIPSESVDKERCTREQLLKALRTFLTRRGRLAKDDRELASLLRATLEWLAGTSANIVMINLEDLWLEIFPQNVPATSRERPNWRRKTAYTLEQITKSRAFRELLTPIATIRSR